jgi:7-keto-8-aminopelargonate synthetase-like enzyme
LLREHVRPRDRVLLLTDGVFAATGSLAPLAEYRLELGRYEGSMLLVDDAHGLATLGALGRGSLELAGVAVEQINAPEQSSGAPRVFHSTTLSKAVGGHGGVLAGSAAFLQRVRNSSGWFRGSSAPAAPVAAATAKGLEIVAGDPVLRQRLAANVTQARAKLAALALDVEESPSPIVGIRLRDAAAMQRVQQRLLDDGIAISYTRDYAGAGPEGLLRIAIFATHTPAMIERLAEALGRAL